MIHESLQTNIIRKNRLRALTWAAISTRGMRRAGIQLAKQEACLRASGVADDETREREAILDEILLGFQVRTRLSYE